MSIWLEAWTELRNGARRGARDAVVGIWTPFRPRYWRYVARCGRQRGLRAAFKASFDGYDLILARRLDAKGREAQADESAQQR